MRGADSKSLLAFLRAIFRHWLVLFSGPIISTGVGAIEHYQANSLSFATYGALSAATTFAAAFMAWRDERDARQVAEAMVNQNRPIVTAEFTPVSFREVAFLLTNTGGGAAFNVSIADWQLAGKHINFSDVASIDQRSSAVATITVTGDGPMWSSRLPDFLKSAYASAAEAHWMAREASGRAPGDDEGLLLVGVGEIVIPISITYRDAAGAKYATVQELHFEKISERMNLRLVYTGRKDDAPSVESIRLNAGRSADLRRNRREQ
jgi:hypothetical protein